jgi:drug/metabolite transporter (DMT)-like permease
LLSVTSDFKISKGDVLTLVCALLWAGQILVIDRVARNGDPLQIACLQFALCAVLSVLSGLAFETCTLAQVKAASGAIAYGGLMSVGIAFTLQVICQKRCPPAPAAIIMSLEAVFAAIAGYLVLNQELTVRAILGCVLIFVGVVMAQLLPLLKRAEGGDQKS